MARSIRGSDAFFYRKDGSAIPVSYSSRPIIDKGRIVGAVICFRNITERRKAEEAIRKSEAFLNMLLETIPIPVFYKDREGRYLGFNKAFETFFGKSKEQLIGRSAFDITTPELAKLYYNKDLELFEKPGVQIYDSQVKDAHGIMHDVIFYKASLIDAQGSPPASSARSSISPSEKKPKTRSMSFLICCFRHRKTNGF